MGGVFGDVAGGDGAFFGEGVSFFGDEEWVVGYDGSEFDIFGDVEHRADAEVDFSGAEHFHAFFSGDVCESEVDSGEVFDEALYECGEDVLDGGAASGDDEAS